MASHRPSRNAASPSLPRLASPSNVSMASHRPSRNAAPVSPSSSGARTSTSGLPDPRLVDPPRPRLSHPSSLMRPPQVLRHHHLARLPDPPLYRALYEGGQAARARRF